MDILAQVNYVNEKLKEGFSTVKIEKSLKLGKDTLRKRLNKNGYKYNRKLNQYILVVENLKKLSTNINKQKQNSQLTEEEIKILREFFIL